MRYLAALGVIHGHARPTDAILANFLICIQPTSSFLHFTHYNSEDLSEPVMTASYADALHNNLKRIIPVRATVP